MATVSDSSQYHQKEITEDIGLDYEEAKYKYLMTVENFYSSRSTNFPFTREVVIRIKSLINEGLALEAAGYSSLPPKYKVMNKYEVIYSYIDKEEILILKRKEKGDPIIQVLPAEDCFEVIMGAHKESKHGGKQVTLNFISKKYSVPKTSIDFVLSLCKECNAGTPRPGRRFPLKPLRIFFRSAHVLIIEMLRPDSKFTHILCLVDKLTKFLILRPLMTSSEDEVAIELLKIFLDFGPPETLEAYDRELFTKSMNLINKAYEFYIPVVFPGKAADIGPTDVIHKLEEWQSNTKSSNWAVGCHLVQWETNTKTISSGKSPYEAVFRMEPCIGRKNDEDDGEPEGQVLLYKDDSVINTFNTNLVGAPDNDVHMIGADDLRDLLRDKEVVSEEQYVTQITNTDDVEVISDSESIPDNSEPKKEDKREKNYAQSTNVTKQAKIKFASQIVSHMNIIPIILRKCTGNRVELTTVQKSTADGAGIIVKNIKQNKVEPPKPAKRTCPICNTFIDPSNVYTCVKCNKNVHLFCSDRLLQPEVSPDVLTVTCINCTFPDRDIVKRNNYHEKKT